MKRMHPFNPTLQAGEHTLAAYEGRVQNGSLRTTTYVNEISAYAAKQKQKEARRNAPQEHGPTPERMRKADAYAQISVPVKDKDTRATSKATKFLTVFEDHKSRLPEHLSAALQSALDDFETALMHNGKLISSYGEGGGSAPGPRHGGMPDHRREAFSRVIALRSYMDVCWEDFLTYVVEVANAKRYAEIVCPWTDKATLKGVHFGWDLRAVYSLAKQCYGFQRRERALNGRAQFTAEEISAGRMARRERMAKGER